MWGATGNGFGGGFGGAFQSTLPVWGATKRKPDYYPCGIFQSTLPVWGATSSKRQAGKPDCYFNPRSPCGERRPLVPLCQDLLDFNPRSPCGERLFRSFFDFSDSHFNPRSPCGERPNSVAAAGMDSGFQSTLPVWGATLDLVFSCFLCFISIHAPRVGSDHKRFYFANPSEISIHAPRVGSDHFVRLPETAAGDFNPRSPCGERPLADHGIHFRLGISIHAPRVGSDVKDSDRANIRRHFNPRSPCGERPGLSIKAAKGDAFQSTLPVWGATGAYSTFVPT